MQMNNSGNHKDTIIVGILAVIIVLVIVIAAVVFVLPNLYNPTRANEEEKPDEPTLTMNFSNVSLEFAYNLLNKTEENTTPPYTLKIIDCRGLEGCSTCQFKNGHLPDAELNENWKTLYNTTEDILVYSRDGKKGAVFCENLTGFVYGNIYNLKGGFNAWLVAGYPTEKGRT